MITDIKLALAPETIKRAEKYAQGKGYTSWVRSSFVLESCDGLCLNFLSESFHYEFLS